MTSSLIKKLTENVITKWLEPKLDKALNTVEGKALKAIHDRVKDQFHKYLERRYLKFVNIETIVFQNSPKPLKELYEPLNLIKGSRDQYEKVGSMLIKTDETGKYVNETDLYKTESYKIDSDPNLLLKGYNRILICDDAGMGKSTLTRILFLSIIENSTGIPVLIELRKLNKNHTIYQELIDQVSNFRGDVNENLIRELFSRGDFIFLLDGYDEIPLSDKDFVICDIQRLLEYGLNNKFILTSRPENSLVQFKDFENFFIEPLNIKQSYSILERYDRFNYKNIAESLISEIQKVNNESIASFLTNPFLVSLLFKAYHYKGKIPFHKPQFFQQIFEALYENHDLSKEGYFVRPKKCGLHMDDFKKVLRHLGFLTAKRGMVEFSESEIIQILDRIKTRVKLEFKSSDFIKDLRSTVPLIREEGINLRWTHKAMQDYFAAAYIFVDANEKQNQILLDMFNGSNNSRYLNIFDIFFDLDYQVFKNTILREWTKRFITCYESYLDSKGSISDREYDMYVSSKFMVEEGFIYQAFAGWLYRSKVEGTHNKTELRETFSELSNYTLDYKKIRKFNDHIEKELKDQESDDFYEQ